MFLGLFFAILIIGGIILVGVYSDKILTTLTTMWEESGWRAILAVLLGIVAVGWIVYAVWSMFSGTWDWVDLVHLILWMAMMIVSQQFLYKWFYRGPLDKPASESTAYSIVGAGIVGGLYHWPFLYYWNLQGLVALAVLMVSLGLGLRLVSYLARDWTTKQAALTGGFVGLMIAILGLTAVYLKVDFVNPTSEQVEARNKRKAAVAKQRQIEADRLAGKTTEETADNPSKDGTTEAPVTPKTIIPAPSFALDESPSERRRIEKELLDDLEAMAIQMAGTKDPSDGIYKGGLLDREKEASDYLKDAEQKGYLRAPGGEYGPPKMDGTTKLFKAYEDQNWIHGLGRKAPRITKASAIMVIEKAVPELRQKNSLGLTTDAMRLQAQKLHDALAKAHEYDYEPGKLRNGFNGLSPLEPPWSYWVDRKVELVEKVKKHREKWDKLP